MFGFTLNVPGVTTTAVSRSTELMVLLLRYRGYLIARTGQQVADVVKACPGSRCLMTPTG